MKKINKLFDRLFWGGLIGGIFPILFFIIGWWGSIGRLPEDKIFLVAFAGFIWGLLLDFLILRKILNRFFELSLWLMGGAYLFYSIVLYGFFMGFPVFNVILGIPAGMYMGQRLSGAPPALYKKGKMVASLFTSLVLLFLCISTAALTLNERNFGRELQHMFRLPFAITRPMLWSLILVGGVLLLAVQYCITSYFIAKSSRYRTE